MAVFEEGWAGDKFYILLHGKLRVFKADVQLALLDAHPADDGGASKTSYPFFGEMALMDAAPRMASVHTLSPCKILSLSRANFGRFLSLVPDFKDRVARTKSVRKKESEINVGAARGPTKDDIAVSAPLDDKLDDVHQILALQQAHIHPPHTHTLPIPCRLSSLSIPCRFSPHHGSDTVETKVFPATLTPPTPSRLPPPPHPHPHPHPPPRPIFTLTVTRCA